MHISENLLGSPEWEANKISMQKIYNNEDLGKKLQVIPRSRLVNPQKRGSGRNNLGIYLCDGENGEENLQNVVMKIVKTDSWWFYRPHAVSQLGLGTKYLGWTEVDYRSPEGLQKVPAYIMSFVPGVEENDHRHFKYFNKTTFAQLRLAYRLLLDANIIFPSVDYLVQENGQISLMDYDLMMWKGQSTNWKEQYGYEMADAIKRHADWLREKIPRSRRMSSEIDDMEEEGLSLLHAKIPFQLK